MPDIYFNPYPGVVNDLDSGKAKFLATAEAIHNIRMEISNYFNPQTDTPIRAFTLVRDNCSLATFRIEDILYQLSGRQREIGRSFLHLFSKGQVITDFHLQNCENWTLSCLQVPAPILEFALRNNGIAASIATEVEWETDFLAFEESEVDLPNVWGQPNLSSILAWIKKWNTLHLSNIDRLKSNYYNVIICDGVLNGYIPAPSEWPTIFSMFEKALESNFKDDGYQIKTVKHLPSCSLKQLKHRGSGIRVYVARTNPILLGGFYKKNQGDAHAQNAAISKAKQRIESFVRNSPE